MKPSKQSLILAGITALFLSGMSVQAQENDESPRLDAMDEITVTARKREESLKDIPVTIDVLSSDMIDEAGILDMYDFFGLVAGIDMEDPNGDRNGANPAIRGVQSGGNGANITSRRVTTFLDGMPMTGQQGTVNISDAQAIEVYSGPQSAAFGRSTFTGAINYVSRDPGDEFEASVQATVSDLGRTGVTLGLSGPLTDKLGYTLDVESNEYDGPDEWSTTEGYGLGGTSTDYISAKFVYQPTDNVNIEVRALHGETDDESPNRFILSDEQMATCGVDTLSNGRSYFIGNYDCNIGSTILVPSNYNAVTQALIDGGYEAFGLAYSIPGGPVVENERDRIQAELTFDVGDSVLQVLGFVAEEESLVWYDADLGDDPITIAPPMGMNPGGPAIPMGMGQAFNHMANPNTTEEDYLEVRWISPDDQDLRWSIGASYYNYIYDQQVYNAYNAILNPELQDDPSVGPIVPNLIINQEGENIGAFFNVTYDFTDRLTLSVEGRYETDDATSVNFVASDAGANDRYTQSTDAFLPRIGLNMKVTDDVSIYAQVAKGNNPAGVNPDWLSPATIEAINLVHAEIADGTISLANSAIGITQEDVDAYIAAVFYDETTFLFWEEETMINYEVGIKGSFLDNRVELASALYMQDWENQIDGAAVDFDPEDFGGTIVPQADYTPMAMGNGGDARVMGLDTTVTWHATDNFDLRGTLSLHKNEYVEFCNEAASGFGFENDRFAGEPGIEEDCVTMNDNELARTPDTTASLSGTYRAPLGSTNWRYSIRGDWRYTGEQWMDTVNIMSLPASSTLNLNVALSNDNWTFTLYGNNLTDEDTPRIVRTNNDLNAGTQFELNVTPQTPTEFGIRVRYRY